MSRKNSIEVSPKYGVNPTIPVCFWCGKEKNEIALLGRMRKKDGKRSTGDYEAPIHMVIDYEPCDECRSKFEQGVRLIECVSFTEDGRMPISKDQDGNNVFPTGRLFCLVPSAAQQIFNVDKEMLTEGKALCLDRQTFGQIEQMIYGANNENSI